jgi:hypothetical protein
VVTVSRIPTNPIGIRGNHPTVVSGATPTIQEMSITVDLDDLAATTAGYGWAYLLTVRDDLRPHVVAVSPTWEGPVLVAEVGRGTASHVGSRPDVTLCYPPVEPGGYTLIVDGTGSVDGQAVRFTPGGAVLHRPAPGATGPPVRD